VSWVGAVFAWLLVCGIAAVGYVTTFLGARSADRWIQRRTTSQMVRTWVTVFSGVFLFAGLWLPTLFVFGSRATVRRVRQRRMPVIVEG
jgi:Na+/H+ antiporter NhaC